MDIPVAVVTDCDVKEYEKEGSEYQRRNDIDSERKNKIREIESKSFQNVNYFVAPHWTLEYSLFLSQSLTAKFQEIVKSIHSGTNWDSDFEKELAKKLINKSLEKTKIAYQLATHLDSLRDLDISAEDNINYLKKAIKYAAGN